MRISQTTSSSALSALATFSLTSGQIRTDGMLGNLCSQAFEPHNILAMTFASLGFSVTRTLITPLFSNLCRIRPLVQGGTWLTALLGEVSIF